MNSILSEYYSRFFDGKSFQFSSFFTQNKVDNYVENLPYIFDIESAVLRIIRALLLDEKVCIYSDYDTDAVTAVGVMYKGFLELGFKKENLSFYAPDRFTEGYGMNPEAVEELAQKNDLIITVDCGINSTLEAEVVKKSKCDLIITDHHHLHGNLPDCVSVVNPRLNEYYTTKNESEKQETLNDLEKKSAEIAIDLNNILENNFDYISWQKRFEKNKQKTNFQNSTEFLSASVTGVGVAWFVVVWLGYTLNFLVENNLLDKIYEKDLRSLNSFLSLVAVGTVADCQSVLESTNRLLVKAGIQVIKNQSHNVLGLEELLKQTGIRAKIDQGYVLNSQDLAFYLSPILNSSGRLTHANLSIKTLLADNEVEAEKFARELVQTNEERKQIVKEAVAEVDEVALAQYETEDTYFLWLAGSWGKGIVGLLASRLVNKFDLPVVVVSKEGDKAVASLRAPEGYHLVEAMQTVEDYLEKFGGHPGAAGFSAKDDSLKKISLGLGVAFKKQSENLEGVKNNFAGKDFKNILPKDLEYLTKEKNLIWLESGFLNEEFLKKVLMMDPFGQDFPVPEFVTKLSSFKFKFLGNENKHIKVFFGDSNMSAVVFGLDENQKREFLDLQNEFYYKEIEGKNLWLKLRLTQNVWNGSTKLELLASKIWLFQNELAVSRT